ncbi:MAG TPA: hypothetical protein VGH12_02815 [Steroidobacteraceae bacterium]
MSITLSYPALAHSLRILPTLLILGGAALSGCASTSVSGEWQPGAPRNVSFKKVLVVGLSPNYNTRCAFEYSLARAISNGSVVGMDSCHTMTMKQELTKENVVKAVEATQADAVLVTSLVAMKMETKEGAGTDSLGSALYKATDYGFVSGYYGGYGMPIVYGTFVTSPSITTLHGAVHVMTRVYETQGATFVYQLDTKAKDLESRDDALMDIIPAIANRLRQDNIIL